MFAGRTWWIVGASEGLGRALAKALDAEGATLVLSARSQDRLEELAGELGSARAVAMDVTDRDSVARAVSEALPVDGVIYCAGLYEPLTAQDWDEDAVLAMCDVNFMGAVRILGRVVPDFAARGAGHIVVIGSLAGFRGLSGAIGYGASKAGLMHLAENIRMDLRGSGVTVQQINPGFIETRLTAKNDFAMPFIMTPERAATHVVAAIRSGRFQTSFPRPFSWVFQIARLLPGWLYRRVF